jgi:hypothetical protein
MDLNCYCEVCVLERKKNEFLKNVSNGIEIIALEVVDLKEFNMDDEDVELEIGDNEFFGIPRNTDYSVMLFELSRTSKIKREQETEYTVIIERAWAGDVSRYIVELENRVAKLTNFIKLQERVESINKKVL